MDQPLEGGGKLGGAVGGHQQPGDAIPHGLGHAADIVGDDRQAVGGGLVDQDRAKLGLSPLYTGDTKESAEVIAKRITEDAATLVALSKGVKDLIADKDAERAQTAKELSDALQVQSTLRDRLAAAEKERDQALIEASAALGAALEIESEEP